eukprot:scaffold4990_cov387-Prasinococcus_capsulatus_cf.AAC.20
MQLSAAPIMAGVADRTDSVTMGTSSEVSSDARTHSNGGRAVNGPSSLGKRHSKYGPPDAGQSVAAMCDVTAGKYCTVRHMKELLQSIEEMAGRNQATVVVNLERLPAQSPQQPPLVLPTPPKIVASEGSTAGSQQANDPLTTPNLIPTTPPLSILQQQQEAQGGDSTHMRRVMCIFHGGASSWPIPEGFLLGPNASSIPPREAQPYMYYKALENVEYTLYPGLPVDKYDLEVSSLNASMAQQRKGACWPLYIRNSLGDKKMGLPFGYLRLNHTVRGIHYVLFPLGAIRSDLDLVPSEKCGCRPRAAV